ncbi:hypothetical protein [Micromonospora sp. WMMD736]|uniref:hypothetical protein n=1 Tax=Micromonospora sp. WMMD736 TaxID=3404112 RepID=UPI003B954E5B
MPQATQAAIRDGHRVVDAGAGDHRDMLHQRGGKLFQRIVKWTEGYPWESNPAGKYVGGSKSEGRVNDLDHGAVFTLDLRADSLAGSHPDLLQALSRQGQVGRIVSHCHEVVSSHRIWTFVVEFDA